MIKVLFVFVVLAFTTTTCQAGPQKEAIYQPGEIPNQPVRINKENFPFLLQDQANPLWLLKFYAPWYVRAFVRKGRNE